MGTLYSRTYCNIFTINYITYLEHVYVQIDVRMCLILIGSLLQPIKIRPPKQEECRIMYI